MQPVVPPRTSQNCFDIPTQPLISLQVQLAREEISDFSYEAQPVWPTSASHPTMNPALHCLWPHLRYICLERDYQVPLSKRASTISKVFPKTTSAFYHQSCPLCCLSPHLRCICREDSFDLSIKAARVTLQFIHNLLLHVHYSPDLPAVSHTISSMYAHRGLLWSLSSYAGSDGPKVFPKLISHKTTSPDLPVSCPISHVSLEKEDLWSLLSMQPVPLLVLPPS